MFYIIVFGDWGCCNVSIDGCPTWDIDNTLLFLTRQEAADYITNCWKDWKDTMYCMKIKKMEA